jgi:uncharacterized membrane protein
VKGQQLEGIGKMSGWKISIKDQTPDKIEITKKPKKHNTFRIHCACIAFGTILAVAVTWTNMPIAHIAVIFPAVPSVLQEFFDKIWNL